MLRIWGKWGNNFLNEEISTIGLKGSGVKAISLKEDKVVSAHIFSDLEYLTVITDKKTGKRIKLSEFEIMSRARKGILMVRDVKTNPYKILKTFAVGRTTLTLKLNNDFIDIKTTELPITDRYSTGSAISKVNINDIFEKVKLEKDKKEEIVEVKEEVSLEQIDEKIMTIDDFLDDFKLD